MSGVNKVILVGNLGKDPEVRYTGAGQAVANFSIATNENWTDKAGQKQERTEWHRIVVWGKLGEVCGEHLTKGRQVYLEGRIETREWTDKEGKKNYSTEINASQVVFLADGKGAKTDPNDGLGTPPPGSQERAPAQRSSGADQTNGAVFAFGKSKGQPVFAASLNDLNYYAGKCREALADSSKSRWHANERTLLTAIEGELARQSGGGGSSRRDDFGPPPPGFDDPPQSNGHGRGGPSDDDIPF